MREDAGGAARAIAVLCLVAAWPAACSSSGGDGGGAAGCASVGEYCGVVCARSHDCDNTVDEQTCRNECANALSVQGPKLRCEFMGGLMECMQRKDCAAYFSGDASEQCGDEAAATLAPTHAGTQFCTDWENARTKCSSTLDKTACLALAKVMSDAAVRDAAACTSKACTDIDACVDAALGGGIFATPTLCDDTCMFAFDGECDDLGACAYGTDCFDCGPR